MLNARKLDKWPLAAWLAVVIAFFVWEGADYRGLFQRAAEWQFRLIGYYKPAITVALLAVLLAIPALAIGLARQLWKRRRERDGAPPPYTLLLGRARWTLRLLNAFAALLAGFALVSLLLMLRAPHGGAVAQTVAANAPFALPTMEGPTLMTGVVPERRVAIHGVGLFGAWQQNRFAALPFRTRDGLAVRYFVELPPSDVLTWGLNLRRGDYTGVLVRNGLPDTLARMYRNHDYDVLEPHFVLYQSARTVRRPYLITAVDYAVGALIVLLVTLYQRRQVRRLSRIVSDEALGISPA